MRGALVFCLCSLILVGCYGNEVKEERKERHHLMKDLVRDILDNQNFAIALNISKSTLTSSFNSGTKYPQVWIRHVNAFLELSLEVQAHDKVRDILVTFGRLQNGDGSIPDGYDASSHMPFTHTTESDQETSWVQAIYKYVNITRDSSILDIICNGTSMQVRMDRALQYVFNNKFSSFYGLVFGATTIDWGDIQPEDVPGYDVDSYTHPAIDVYDNAMMSIAIQNYLSIAQTNSTRVSYYKNMLISISSNVTKYLWDSDHEKYHPHVYIYDRPFPLCSEEDAIYYHGGTTIAALAGYLSRDQIMQAYLDMVKNVNASGGQQTIGLSVYPPYMPGLFQNPTVSEQYSYQNGGDFDWFGGRMVQVLIREGFIPEAMSSLVPMVDRVVKARDYYEWWDYSNKPMGSGAWHAGAGAVGQAIAMLQSWARSQAQI